MSLNMHLHNDASCANQALFLIHLLSEVTSLVNYKVFYLQEETKHPSSFTRKSFYILPFLTPQP